MRSDVLRAGHRGKRDQLSPIFTEFLASPQSAPPLTATSCLNAWAELDLLRAKTLEEMSAYPVLLCPVASIPAFRHGEREWTVEGETVEYLDAVRYTQWFNVLAAPAAVVPVGRSPEGLPIGVQIVARPFEDEIALGIAAIVDEAFGYRPPPPNGERNKQRADLTRRKGAAIMGCPSLCSAGSAVGIYGR